MSKKLTPQQKLILLMAGQPPEIRQELADMARTLAKASDYVEGSKKPVQAKRRRRKANFGASAGTVLKGQDLTGSEFKVSS